MKKIVLYLSAFLLIFADVAEAATQVSLIAISPNSGQAGITNLAITGSGFPSGTISPVNVTVTLTGGNGPLSITPTSVITVGGSIRRVTFTIPSGDTVTIPTAYQVSISGSSPAFTSNSVSLTVNPEAQISSLAPASGMLGQTVPVTVSGLYTNFVQGSTTASFPAGSGITVSNFTVTGLTTATATLNISSSATVQTNTMTVATGIQTATVPFSVGVVTQASSNSYGATATGFHSVSSMTSLTAAQKLALLQQNIKYVFVIFQENRSYDHYFGTFPGANGLFATYPNANPNDPSAQPGNATQFASSFNSAIQTVTPSGSVSYSTVKPFLVPRQIVNQSGATTPIYSEDMYSVDHSHTGYIADLHSDQATRSIPKNDGFPLDQEGLYYNTDTSGTIAPIYSASTHAAPTSQVTLQAKQKG